MFITSSQSRPLFLPSITPLAFYSRLKTCLFLRRLELRKALCFTRDVYWLFFLKFAIGSLSSLGHVIDISINFITQVQKLGGPFPKKFRGPKTCKIWRDFTQLPTLNANISRTKQDIPNRKDMWSRMISPTFKETSPVNFDPLSKKQYMYVSLDPPKSTFSENYILAQAPVIFTRARHWPSLASAHHKLGRRLPQKF